MSHRLSRLAFAAALVAGIGACGEEATPPAPAAEEAVRGADTAPIGTTPERASLTLRGPVRAVQPAGFMLDHAGGTITVRMDDWDWYREGAAIQPGTFVTVNGHIDEGFLGQARLDARTIYVEGTGTYYYATGADQGDLGVVGLRVAPAGSMIVTGRVAAIDGRALTIGNDGNALRVDTSGMGNNPLDAEGEPQVRSGDRIAVWGRIDTSSGAARELMAQDLVVLRQDRTKGAAAGGPAAGQGNQNAANPVGG